MTFDTRSPRSVSAQRWGVEALWWLAPLAFLVAWLPAVASSALFDPDEGRNASIARAMASGGSWLLPHLNGLPFLDKPFLFFSLQASAMRLFGVTELAARLPSLVASALQVALLAWFVDGIRGRRAAWLTAVAGATSLLVIAFARVASFDAVLSLTTTTALIALYRVVEAPEQAPPQRRSPWLWLAWGAMVLGTLTKGPVAILLPLLVGACFAWVRGRSRSLWLPGPVLAGLGALLLWALLVEARVEGFLRYALVEESWNRVTTDRFQRTGPPWYFLPILALGAFPWVVPALTSLRATWRQRAKAPAELLFATLWLVAPLVLLSFSQSKRPQYMLPLVPAVTLLAAFTLDDENGGPRRIRRCAVALWSIALGLALGPRWLEGTVTVSGVFERADLSQGRFLVMAVLASCGALAWLFARRLRLGTLFLALPLALVPLITTALIQQAAEGRSSRGLVHTLQAHFERGATLIGVDTFVPSLPFYLGRDVVLSSDSLAPTTSQSMTYFEPSLRDMGPPSVRPGGWWRGEISRAEGGMRLFLVKRGRSAEISELEGAGLHLLAEDRKFLIYGLPLREGLLSASVEPEVAP